MKIYIEQAEGGFIVGLPLENENHIFVTFGDAVDFAREYMEIFKEEKDKK